jgi:hypothetical protein
MGLLIFFSIVAKKAARPARVSGADRRRPGVSLMLASRAWSLGTLESRRHLALNGGLVVALLGGLAGCETSVVVGAGGMSGSSSATSVSSSAGTGGAAAGSTSSMGGAGASSASSGGGIGGSGGSGGAGGTGGMSSAVASSSSASSSSASSSSGGVISACPAPPPPPGPTWVDCSVGLDPTKNGGDLLWASAMRVGNAACLGWPDLGSPLSFAVGPTGDIAVSGVCSGPGTVYGLTGTLNGAGTPRGTSAQSTGGTGTAWVSPSFDRYGDLVVFFNRDHFGPVGEVSIFGPVAGNVYGFSFPLAPWNWPPTGGSPPSWDTDATGHFFVAVEPFGSMDLVRSNGAAQSIQPGFIGAFVADQTGGVYRYGALAGPLDLGCGAMVPASPSSGYLAHLDAAWSCLYSRVLPASVAAFADPSGGITLAASSSVALDLGCGSLPAAPGGSTFITRLDAAGACVFHRSLGSLGLTVALDTTGRVVVSRLVGASTVNLGGGPLPPLGTQDVVVGELDSAGKTLWSKRFGAPGVTFGSATVTTSAAGDVYLLASTNGAVDLGGGPVAGSVLVGSFSPAGAHRWSRAFAISGGYPIGIDGCGGLVVAGTDASFNPGCGNVLPGPPMGPLTANIAFARFAP